MVVTAVNAQVARTAVSIYVNRRICTHCLTNIHVTAVLYCDFTLVLRQRRTTG
jgi:hypothetical protein